MRIKGAHSGASMHTEVVPSTQRHRRPYWTRMYATSNRVCLSCSMVILKGDVLWIGQGKSPKTYCVRHRPSSRRSGKVLGSEKTHRPTTGQR